ncbi:MAG: hypothetical protein ACR2N7_04610 [Acidimicrobiia bacterium]
MKKFLIVGALCAVVLAACSSEPEETLVGIRASTDPAIGDSRFLFAVNEIGGERRGSPDELVTYTATPLDAPGTALSGEASFVWVVPNGFGLYKADVPFDTAGMWEFEFSVSTGENTEPFLVLVAEEPATVAVGENAPLVASPTLSDTPVEDLTTDHPVQESLYELSLDDALQNGNKTVAIFATPAFCTSAACGPMMTQAKDVSSSYPDVNWVHVEVYSGFNESGFVPDADHLVPSVVAFGLPSEPWIFVMDESGVVTARLEGVLADGELESLLDA